MIDPAFLKQIMELAKRHGWRTAHLKTTKKGWPASSGDTNGFPDIILVRNRVLWIVLRNADGPLLPAQADWWGALVKSGQNVFIWSQDDWDSILQELK